MKWTLAPLSEFAVAAMAAAGLAALAGLGFALWMDNGSSMLVSLMRTGLAWCL